MRVEAENWWIQAKADLKTARDNISTRNYYASAFFSQQTVEKALKALYIVKKKDFPPKEHNLFQLGLLVKVPKELFTILRSLTPEFVSSRYPDAASGVPVHLYDKKIATTLLKDCEKVIMWVEKQLK